MSDEEWKPVPGWDGLYEVSNEGRVRSLARTLLKRGGTMKYRLPEKILSNRISGSGYPAVFLCRDGVREQATVHTLVLQAFVGPRPTSTHKGLHRDDNPRNNHVSNLYWGTMQENALDRVRNGRDRNARKTKCNRGHALIGPNLAPWSSVNRRACLACNRANTLARKRGHRKDEKYISSLADEKYEAIMVGVSRG